MDRGELTSQCRKRFTKVGEWPIYRKYQHEFTECFYAPSWGCLSLFSRYSRGCRMKILRDFEDFYAKLKSLKNQHLDASPWRGYKLHPTSCWSRSKKMGVTIFLLLNNFYLEISRAQDFDEDLEGQGWWRQKTVFGRDDEASVITIYVQASICNGQRHTTELF